eukprot:gb/GECG01010744.1/.p1 GENE.gb/GECG01010744.1/~~gb/GECG01010744.1/.p1  ORF type:complete len:226 (+),score=26.37 gb/GECG01010744.1/:1-678(+)
MLQFGRAIGKRPQLQFQGGIVRALWLYPWRFQGAKYSIDSDSSSDEEESVRQEARGSAKYLGRVYPRGPANDAYDNEIMSLALELARECFEKDEVPIGAIILNHKGKVIGAARNHQQGAHDTLAHAEMNALNVARRYTNASRLDGCRLYCTVEPCIMCFGACLLHHIDEVIYGASSPVFGACGSSVDVQRTESSLNHRITVRGGVMEEECSSLMKEFFKKKRQKC